MAITDSEEGVWGLDEVYNKINQDVWRYGGGDNETGLWVWGNGGNAQTGQNNTTAQSSPVQIQSSPSGVWTGLCGGGGEDASFVFGFQDTKTSNNTNGKLYSWGWNIFGNLGQNQTGNLGNRSSPMQLPGGNWHYITRGRYTAFGLKTDATLWSWGYNGQGVLGQGQSSHQQRRSSPVRIGSNNDHLPTGLDWNISGGGYPSGTRNRKMTISGYAGFAMKEDNSLWSWGSNSPAGRLGHNNQTSYASPKQIGTDTSWAYMSTGQRGGNVMAIKQDGSLWGWGNNDYGDLGMNNRTNYSSPKQVGIDGTWTDVSLGTRHTVALKSDNTMWTWGENDSGGALGLNTSVTMSSPCQVPGSWNEAIGAYRCTMATKTDGTTWIWGGGHLGALGQNATTPNNQGFSSPVQIMGKASATNLLGLYFGMGGIFSPPG